LLIGLGVAFFLYEWALPGRIKTDLKRKCGVSILTSVDRITSRTDAVPATTTSTGGSGETSAR
jgi:hypothetical protein